MTRLSWSLVLFTVGITQDPVPRPTNPPSNPPNYHAANYTFVINWYHWKENEENPCVKENFISDHPHFQQFYQDTTQNTKTNTCTKVCHDANNCADEDQSHIADYRLHVQGYHPQHWYDRVVNRTLEIYPNAGWAGDNQAAQYNYYGPPGTCKANKAEPRWEQDMPCNFGAPRIQCSSTMHNWSEDWPYAFEVEDDVSCTYTQPPSHNPTTKPTEPPENGGGWGTAAIVVCSLLAMCGLGAYFWRNKKSENYANIESTEKVAGPNGTIVDPL